MSDVVETVTVHAKDGSPLIVNKSDYDADPKRWGKTYDPKNDTKAKADPVEPPPMLAGNPLNPAGQPEGRATTPAVVQKGDKYFVQDDKGETPDGFSDKGYKTDIEAWSAVAEWQKAHPENG